MVEVEVVWDAGCWSRAVVGSVVVGVKKTLFQLVGWRMSEVSRVLLRLLLVAEIVQLKSLVVLWYCLVVPRKRNSCLVFVIHVVL